MKFDPPSQIPRLQSLARLIRYYCINATSTAHSGHLTSSLSATDLMTGLLFGGAFRFSVVDPESPNNDRLIFSKGHASPLFYALWAAARCINEKELMSFRHFRSRIEGHPTPITMMAVRKIPLSGSPEELSDFEEISAPAIVKTVEQVLATGKKPRAVLSD